MFDSGYPSAKKRASNYDDTTYIRTSVKSGQPYQSEDYHDRTPERSPYRSNAHPVVGRLESAKRSINEAIEIVSDKKQMNYEGIGEVRQVNTDILGSLTGYSPIKPSGRDYRNRTADQLRSSDPQDFVSTSHFDWRQSQEPNQGSGVSISQENSDLRSRLNSEIKKNNDMIRHISNLEAENSSLKASTRGNNPNVANLLEENKNLRNQLANSSSNAPYNLREELQRLKEENNQLRRDTVTLLKNKQGY